MRSVNLARGERAGTDPRTGGGALDQLRAATSPCHRRLEKRLNIAQRFASLGTYRVYLEVMFGYHAPIEEILTRHPVRYVLRDYAERRKTALLAADLRELGVTAEAIAALRRCPRHPLCQDEAAALGTLYVLEGATLGGQILLPMVQQRLQLTRQSGASYLGSYGPEVPAMWQRFCATVEDWCSDGTRRAIAATAAIATFESLEEWLCGESA
jgi:heme oxygenase (biliverdin-IX-beta and delta-forming)